MATNILVKRSTATGAVPTAQNLQTGELAVNTVDRRIFTNNQGTIVELGTTPSSITTSTATIATGTAQDFTVTGTLTVSAPTQDTDASSKAYVDAKVASLVDSSPAALDTLNELAAAINDDANFFMKVLFLTGGTMTGDIVMGANRVVSTANPTTNDTLTRKGYVDSILGSATDAATSAVAALASEQAAATSASNASTSETNASGSASNAASSASAASTSASQASTSATSASTSASQASTSATQAQTAATNAENAFDSFDDRYLGAKTSDPTLDNDGEALLTGALYFNSTAGEMKVYDGNGWTAAGSSVNGTSDRNVFIATEGQTVFSGLEYDTGFVDVYLNGVKLIVTTDFTADTGTSVTLTTGATAGDTVDIVAYGSFNVANVYTQAQSDARFATTAQGALADSAVQPDTTPSFTGLDIPVEEQVGGGALVYGKVNLLTDSLTYTLPLANTVSSGDFIIVEKDETNKADTPTVSRSGSDDIVYSGGTDTDLQFDAETSQAIRFVSNGTDGWRI